MTLRLRLTVVVAVATAIVFALGSLLFTTILTSDLLASLDTNLAAQATQAFQAIPGPGGQENLQDAGGRSVGSGQVLGSGVPSEYLLQVYSPRARLIEANQAAGSRPLLAEAQLRKAVLTPTYVTTPRPAGSEQLRLLVDRVPGPSGGYVVVGASLETIDETLHNVDLALIIAGCIVVVLAVAAAYLLARAALAPVEAMRREVQALLPGDLPSSAVIEVPSTHDELARLGQTMNDLLGRLSRSLTGLAAALQHERTFVADAGHELRTPLSVLRAELELATRPGRSRTELDAALRSALGEAEHVSRLAEDLLLLSARDGNELSCLPEQVELVVLLEHSIEMVVAKGARRQVAIEVIASPGLEVLVDPGRIRQVLDNLLDNALRHAPDDSTITVSTERDGSTLRISVADRGPGFPLEFLPRAFDRFARADVARSRETGGTGLGLAIVAGIAAAHGGQASAANRLDGGAVLTVEIPDAVVLADSRWE